MVYGVEAKRIVTSVPTLQSDLLQFCEKNREGLAYKSHSYMYNLH